MSARNGNGASPAAFPVDSFRDAATHLRRPFTPAAVKFKLQATWEGSGSRGAGGLVVAYIDARLVVERLNLVCPHLWTEETELGAKGAVCRLTVDDLTRSDVGDGGDPKSRSSDALKRAAVRFGIGVSLYATPKNFVDLDNGHMKARRGSGDKYELTDAGERACRERYARWLESHGTRAFGEPLDHGDVEDAQGDHEADVAASVSEEPADPGADAATETITQAIAKALVDGAWSAELKDKLQLAASHAHGADVGDCSTKAKATSALRSLTEPEAQKVADWIERKQREANEQQAAMA